MKIIREIRANYQIILLIILVVMLFLIVYGHDLNILFNEAIQTEAFSHILLVPLFGAFLFYLKRKSVRAALSLEKTRRASNIKFLDNIAGVVFCLTALLVYWYGSHTFYPLEYHMMSIPIFLMGVILVLSNSKVLFTLIFPVLFLLFLVPPPMEIMYAAGGVMANFETQASYMILRTFGVPVTLSYSYGPPAIQLSTSSNPVSFAVDLPCSGIYSLMAFAMFSAFLAFISKASIKRKALMFLAGFLIFEVLNIVRITVIVSIAYSFGQEVAMLIFHSIAGLLLIFIGMLLTLVIADKILKVRIFIEQEEIKSCPRCRRSLKNNESFCLSCGKFLDLPNLKVSRETWAKILLLIVGCWLATISINAPTFAMAKESIEILPSTSLTNTTETNILPEISGYRLRFLYRDVNYERIAHQDAALVYAYFPTANYSKPTIYVSINVANSISNLHSWEVCLITWQTARGYYPSVLVLDSKEIQLLEGAPIIARYLVFKHPENYTQATLYWFERATFNVGVTVEQKYVRISLITLTYESTSYKKFEDELLSVGKIVASHWEPLKVQSLISLGIPTLQLLLAVSIVSLLFMKITQYTYETRKRTENLKIFRRFASKKEKLILQVLVELAKEKKNIETTEILSYFKEKTGKSIRLNKLIDFLERLEEYRFLKRDILTVGNTPKLVWKIHISSI